LPADTERRRAVPNDELAGEGDESMNGATHREFACAILIDKQGRFLLQQRDDVPGILMPGAVGFFGGHREANESFLQCLIRELQEELDHPFSAERLEQFLTYQGPDLDAGKGTARGQCFIVRDVAAHDLNVMEGSLMVVHPDEVATLGHKLAPFPHYALRVFQGKQVPIHGP
jgi:8-oxo-dGTP diphosphatase